MQTNSGRHAMINHRLLRYSTVFLRVALGIIFLTAVTDRFGLWGPPGTNNVSWGNFESGDIVGLGPYRWFPNATGGRCEWCPAAGVRFRNDSGYGNQSSSRLLSILRCCRGVAAGDSGLVSVECRCVAATPVARLARVLQCPVAPRNRCVIPVRQPREGAA